MTNYTGIAVLPGYRWPQRPSLPLLGLGEANALGSSRLMQASEQLRPGTLYTYRTSSLVPLQENAKWPTRREAWGSWASRDITSWENEEGTGSPLVPPGRVASLYQARSTTPYSGSAAGYAGRPVYTTSLTFGVNRDGVTAADASLRAVNILNRMRSDYQSDPAMRVFTGWLYERSARDTPPPSSGLLDRAAAWVTGQDPAAAARQAAAREQTRQKWDTWGQWLMLLGIPVGFFLATRAGSRKLDVAIGKVLGGAGSAAKGTARVAGRAAGAAGKAALTGASYAATRGAIAATRPPVRRSTPVSVDEDAATIRRTNRRHRNKRRR